MEIPFEKYQGLGNDFLIVELDAPSDLPVDTAVALCDRHFGVGGDGVLILSPADGQAAARMTVVNSDGSQPEMCGNGLRCFALHLLLTRPELGTSFTVLTDAGPRHCDLTETPTGWEVRTAMGKGRPLGELNFEFEGQSLSFAEVSMGNPHAITFRDPMSSEELDRLGPTLSASKDDGTNVEIATVRNDNRVEVAVWERGVGRTLACGTGAAATAVAALQAGLCEEGEPVEVVLPGGPLTVRVSPELDVELTGPARSVFSGRVNLAALG